MSGLEPVAALAGKAISKVMDDDPDIRKALVDKAVAHPAMNSAAGSLAKRTAVKEQVRLKLLRPLGWIFSLNKAYFDDDFEDDMAEKMASVPSEDVITPATSVAGPSVQGLLYTLDEPALKEMYLNLLTSASDRRVAEDAHPAYAEIIRQLNAVEAQTLQTMLGPDRVQHHPIINIRVRSLDKDGNALNSTSPRIHYLLPWRDDGVAIEFPKGPMYLENWVRLGLVNISFAEWLAEEKYYSWVEERSEVIRMRTEYDSPERVRVQIERGVMTVTDFGRGFASVVLPETVPPATPEPS